MEESDAHYELERFTQEFKIRSQRRRLGVNLDQDAARLIFNDAPALHLEYMAWRFRTGMPPLMAVIPVASSPMGVSAPSKQGRLKRFWLRFTGR